MAIKQMGINITLGATVANSINSAFNTINDRTKAMSKSLKTIDFKKGLSTNLLHLNKELKTLQKAQLKAGGTSSKLQEKIKATKRAFLDAKLEAKEYGIALKNASKLNKAFIKLEGVKSKNALSLANANQRQSYRNEAKGKLFEKVAIGFSIAAPFKAGIEFESSMKRVKALSNATNDEFKKLNETAKKLGSSTVFSAIEVGQGMQYLSMAGFKANETIQAMPGLLALASAGQTDLATTSDIASNILSGFALKASDMTRVADVLAKTMITANVDTRMLGETMKYVAPVASGLGASIEEVAALSAKLGDGGIQGSMAGTTIKAMYSRLAAPPSEAKKMLDTLGVSTKDANGKFKGMLPLIKELNSAMVGMSNTQKANAMKKLFGTESLGGAMALFKVGADKLKSYEETLLHAQGTAQKIAKEQNDSVAGAFKGLGSAVEGVSISLSSLFLPAIKGITKGITSATQTLNSFITNHKTLATVIGGVAGGIIALSLATFGLKYVFSLVVDGFSSMLRGFRSLVFWSSAEGRALLLNRAQLIATAVKTKALILWQGVLATKTKLMTLWTNRSSLALKAGAAASGIFKVAMAGVNLVLSANPIGLVVVAIGALVGGIIWAYNKFDWFKSGVDKVWGFVKTVFKWSPLALLMQGFGKAFDWLKVKFEWFRSAVNKFKSMGSVIGSWFGFGNDEKKEDEKQNKKSLYKNNVRYEPANAMKKVAVATAVTTALVASPAVHQNNIQHKNLAVQNIKKNNISNINRVENKRLAFNNKKETQNTTVQQTNHIKIIINNPNSNVDVKKAVIDAMKIDTNLSDGEF